MSRDILKPSLKEYLKGAIGVLVSAGILFEVLVWNLFDFHLLSVEMLEQPVSVTTFFYVVAPIQAFFGCVTFASIGHMGSYLVKVSQAIPINLLALERYACLATPAAIFFSGSSLILMSGSLAAQFLGDGFSEGFVRFLFGFGILMLIILMLFLIPIWLVRNRIAKRITFEKSLVQRALEGNRSVLDESTQFPAGGDRSEADLLSRMIFLDGLSEWPIGQNLQRVVIFGLLPPIAWALAAVIENTLY